MKKNPRLKPGSQGCQSGCIYQFILPRAIAISGLIEPNSQRDREIPQFTWVLQKKNPWLLPGIANPVQ
ncbi:MAG: hypothetical protein ICV55_08360 [Coleofasciculus sp. C3-bin4]|nr:hypothetical protein [Coleofasciculus sp. C3-bin4]